MEALSGRRARLSTVHRSRGARLASVDRSAEGRGARSRQRGERREEMESVGVGGRARCKDNHHRPLVTRQRVGVPFHGDVADPRMSDRLGALNALTYVVPGPEAAKVDARDAELTDDGDRARMIGVLRDGSPQHADVIEGVRLPLLAGQPRRPGTFQ